MEFNRIIQSAGIFLISALIAGLFANKSGAASVAIVTFGFLFSSLVLLFPAIENAIKRSKKGEITPKGIKWEIREEPVRAVIPQQPTDTTKSEKAKELCEEGRNLLSQKQSGKDVDLDKALSCFEQAAKLDEEYWEAQLNIAAVTLLQGKPKEALALAMDFRTRFGDIPLAFAKATLIITKIEELRISEKSSEKTQRKTYKKLASMLEESLILKGDHLTTRISLGRVYVLAGEGKETMEKFLTESLKYEDFADKFKNALSAEGITDEFKEEYPDLYAKLTERKPEKEK